MDVLEWLERSPRLYTLTIRGVLYWNYTRVEYVSSNIVGKESV